MAPEEWQPVPGYIDYYSVSSLGRVRLEVDRQGFGSGYILTQYTRKTGYVWVQLRRPKQQYPYAVHELVLSAFDGPRPLGFTADHINGVKSDNRYENLEWVPHVENVRRNRELRHTRLAYPLLLCGFYLRKDYLMAHNLFGDRFMGRREPAWHGLGTTFDEPLTASQAVEIAGLDYHVFTAPVTADVGDLQIPVGKVAIVREPTDDDPEFRVLGMASPNYEVLNNTDIAAIIDPLTINWPVETIGALGHGEHVFMTLALGTTQIKGDPIREYFLITEGKTGGESVTIAYTPVRVVCQNTLTLGLAKATVKSAVVHSTGARAALRFRVDVISRLRLAREEGMGALVTLANRRLGPGQADRIFSAAYPNPKPSAKAQLAATLATSPSVDTDELLRNGEGQQLLDATSLHQYMLDRAAAYREACSECFLRFDDEHPQFANTPYAAFNAVVEVVDFAGIARRGDASSIFGNGASIKERAFAAAINLN